MMDGKRMVWFGYRKTPSLQIAFSGYYLTLVPVEPDWRKSILNLYGYDRYEERIVKASRDGTRSRFLS